MASFRIGLKQDKQCTCNVMLRCVRVTIAAVETQSIVCLLLIHITVNCKQIMSVAKQCCYCKFMSPATI